MIGQRSVQFPPNQAMEVSANDPVLIDAVDLRTETGTLTAPGYAWDFGDFSTATGTSVSHRWTDPGNYRLRLTITDGSHVEIYDRIVRVGLDLDTVSTLKDFASFEAVVLIRLPRPDGSDVMALVPLLAASEPYAFETAAAADPPDANAVTDLNGRLLQAYHQRALMLPVPEHDALGEGLYLLFPRDVVFAGIEGKIADLIRDMRLLWREVELKDSLYEMRKWTIAEEAAEFARTTGTTLPAVFDPTNGFGWLAPGLSGLNMPLALEADAQQSTALSATSLSAGQALLAPSNSLAREQALQWLAIVGGGLCAEVRRFGEQRGLDGGAVLYPNCLFAWNTRDATLAWSVMSTATTLRYWIHGAATFTLSETEARLNVPNLATLPQVATPLARQVLDDAATRQVLGEDRELGDHVVVQDGARIPVRFRTGEVFGPSGGHGTTAAAGVHVTCAFWAGTWSAAGVTAEPLDRLPAVAEAWTCGAPAVEQNLIGRATAPSTTPGSGLDLDTTTTSRYVLRRGGEVRVTTRTPASNTVRAITGVIGPYALGQVERTVSETAPFRNPLKMAVLGSN